MVPDGELDPAPAALLETLLSHVPLSMKAAGHAVARLRRADLADGDDLVREVFGSADFLAGVTAFVNCGQVSRTGR